MDVYIIKTNFTTKNSERRILKDNETIVGVFDNLQQALQEKDKIIKEFETEFGQPVVYENENESTENNSSALIYAKKDFGICRWISISKKQLDSLDIYIVYADEERTLGAFSSHKKARKAIIEHIKEKYGYEYCSDDEHENGMHVIQDGKIIDMFFIKKSNINKIFEVV